METMNEVLDFAIKREIEAAAFYARLAELVDSPPMKRSLLQFSGEEEGHRVKLEAVKAGKLALNMRVKVPSLGIADAVEAREVTDPAAMTYQDVLILAMEREKAAYRLYTELAELVDDEAVRMVFGALAQEEARHKLRFEIEYDEVVLKEN